MEDEKIIAALMTHKTVKEAARSLEISVRSIYNKLAEPEFQGLYTVVKADLLRNTVNSMNAHIEQAVNIIAEVMEDSNTNPAVRLQAAQSMLNYASKFSERLHGLEIQAGEFAGEDKKMSTLNDLFPMF